MTAANPILEERLREAALAFLKDSGAEGFVIPLGEGMVVAAGTRQHIEQLFAAKLQPYKASQESPPH